ncbi:MAG: arsenate reductase [Planctomycetota bacterium]
MLDELGVPYRYREYRDEPLTAAELTRTLELLGLEPHELLRPRESKEAGFGPETGAQELLKAMVEQPTLIQRPIFTNGERALLARPADTLRGFVAEFLGHETD